MNDGDRICSLCGTHYKEGIGHRSNDCWGIIHQQLLKVMGIVRDLEYKLKQLDNKYKINRREDA